MARKDVVAEADHKELVEKDPIMAIELKSTKNSIFCEEHFAKKALMNPGDKGEKNVVFRPMFAGRCSLFAVHCSSSVYCYILLVLICWCSYILLVLFCWCLELLILLYSACVL